MPVAIVTGGSRGFGRAIATDLAKDGWNLVIDGRREAILGETAEELGALGAAALPIAGDVTDPGHRAALVAAAADNGGLDLLVNNASTLGPRPLPTLGGFPLDALREIYEVNVVAPLALIQLAVPLLRRSHGTVVSVSSDAAVEAYEGWGGYGSSKAAREPVHRAVAGAEAG